MKYTDVPILMYHEISEEDNPWCISPADFEQQMLFLKNNGYQTISLSELKHGLEQGGHTMEKLVVITFDDARKGVYTYAYPLLKRCGFKAMVYVVPGWIDCSNVPEGENYSEFMSWEELLNWSREGLDIGSHSYFHTNLISLNDSDLIKELYASQKIIEQKIGRKIIHFSYPYGKFDHHIVSLIQNKYDTAVTVDKGFSKEEGRYARQGVLRNTPLDIFSKLLSPPMISLCMIVKDEEKFLEQCLNSVQGLVDEIIIVDTGSIDGTKEIVKRFTNKIYDFKWCDDFSAARNESLKHATGDWIIILDADEVVAGEDHAVIKEVVNNWNVAGFNMLTRNYSNDSSIQGWVPGNSIPYNYSIPNPYNNSIPNTNNKSAGSFRGWFPSFKVRLFQRKTSVRFVGKMHELVDNTILLGYGKVVPLSVSVHHYGNLRPDSDKKEKYIALTKEKIADDPANAKPYFELGVQYKDSGKFSLAEGAFEQSRSLDDHSVVPLLNLAIVQQKQGKFKEAITNFNKVLIRNNYSADAYFGLGFCYFQQNELHKSAEYFTLAVKHNPLYVDAYVNLGAIYERLGKFDRAVFFLREALRINPQDARAYYNLGVIHEKTMNLEMAVKCYKKAMDLNYPKLETVKVKITELDSFIKKHKSET